MFNTGSTLFRVLAVLVLAGLLLAVGAGLFQAGFSQGYAQGTVQQGDTTQVTPGFRGYPGFYPGWFGPRFGFFPFFPFFGCLFGLLLLFAFGGLFRFGLFGPKRWGYGRHPGHVHSHPHTHTWENDRPAGESQPDREDRPYEPEE